MIKKERVWFLTRPTNDRAPYTVSRLARRTSKATGSGCVAETTMTARPSPEGLSCLIIRLSDEASTTVISSKFYFLKEYYLFLYYEFFTV
jgi:hypothetical protein